MHFDWYSSGMRASPVRTRSNQSRKIFSSEHFAQLFSIWFTFYLESRERKNESGERGRGRGRETNQSCLPTTAANYIAESKWDHINYYYIPTWAMSHQSRADVKVDFNRIYLFVLSFSNETFLCNFVSIGSTTDDWLLTIPTDTIIAMHIPWASGAL